jgi:WS/DGAT/MGAT family acyltransferase
MPELAYDRLSFLDNMFLMMETPTSPMHIAGTATFEAGPLRTTHGRLDIDTIRDYVASRLHLIPRYRQRLARIPLVNCPAWVDDEQFNIDRHVHHSILPKPGDERQLKEVAARVMSQHLARQNPLWEIWILEGLANPAHFVMIAKIHHCMVDGVSSVELLNVLLQLDSTQEFEPPPHWRPRPTPGTWELAMEALGRYARLPLDLARRSRQALQMGDTDFDIRGCLDALRRTVTTACTGVSDTPLNRRIGPHRRLEWLTMDLGTVKGVKRRLGGTLNDIMLATVGGGLRRFLQRRGVHVESLDFRVMAPVSVRTEQERGILGNRISAWMVPIPLRERDPIRRLATIRETTAVLKDSKHAFSTAVLTQVGEWTPSTLLMLGARLAPRVLPFNLVVTNIPGPQVPLYMLGARMVETFGSIPLIESQCLGVVLFSYAGKLCWGFTGERDLVPDLHDFVGDIEASFRELTDAAERMAI